MTKETRPFMSVLPITEILAITVIAINKKICDQLPPITIDELKKANFADKWVVVGYLPTEESIVFMSKNVGELKKAHYNVLVPLGMSQKQYNEIKEQNQLFTK